MYRFSQESLITKIQLKVATRKYNNVYQRSLKMVPLNRTKHKISTGRQQLQPLSRRSYGNCTGYPFFTWKNKAKESKLSIKISIIFVPQNGVCTMPL